MSEQPQVAEATPSTGFLSGLAAQAPETAPADAAPAAAQPAAPPEWLPAKYWDATKSEPRYEDLGRGYQSLERLLGHEKAPVPKDWEDPQQTELWFRAAGRPDTPDGYSLDAPKELPADLPYDEDLDRAYRTFAHQNGLSERQARNLHDQYIKLQVDRHVQYQKMLQQERVELEGKLQREYGQQLAGAMQRTQTALKEFSDPDFYDFLRKSNLDSDPRMIRVFERIGSRMGGERKLVGKPDTPMVSSGDLKAAIAAHEAKYQQALFDDTHPQHAFAVQQRNKLYEQLYAG